MAAGVLNGCAAMRATSGFHVVHQRCTPRQPIRVDLLQALLVRPGNRRVRLGSSLQKTSMAVTANSSKADADS
jgi:hypothetical protein